MPSLQATHPASDDVGTASGRDCTDFLDTAPAERQARQTGNSGSDASIRQVGREGSSIIIGKIVASGFKEGMTEKVVVKTSLVETGICATGYDCEPDN
jgi:hypothetical protein